MQRLVHRFVRDAEGAVAVTGAVMMTLLVVVAGMAIDLGRMMVQRNQVQNAMDTAVLAAANLATADREQDSAAVMRAVQSSFVTSNNSATVRNFTFTATNSNSGGRKVSTIQYGFDYNPLFGRLFGASTIRMTGTAVAQASVAPYYDIVFLLDVSASMGLAATTSGQAALAQINPDKGDHPTAGGCQFACHFPDSHGYDLARSNHIQLRIDAMADAVNAVLTRADTQKVRPDQFRFSIVPFIKKAKVTKGQSTDYRALESAVTDVKSMLDTGSSADFGSGGTDVNGAIDFVRMTSATSGNGSSASSRKSILILITDGAQDDQTYRSEEHDEDHGWGWSSPDWNHKVKSVSNGACQSLKSSRKFTIATLYLVYNPIQNPYGGYDGQEQQLNRTAPGFPDALGDCASSPQLYGVADTPQQMKGVLDQLFSNALNSSLRISG